MPRIPRGLVLLVILSNPIPLLAQDSTEVIIKDLSKPLIRGGIVFKNYCALCHGERGDGEGRASTLYPGVNLRITKRASSYWETIVSRGGEAVGSSPFMPPWQNELSKEQIHDVVAYLSVVADPVRRGEVVYKVNCVLCHGMLGDGRGRAAKLFDPPPADLTHSDKDDAYKNKIIRLGGAAMGRSAVMPVWGRQLTDTQISDVIEYLRSILKTPN